MGARSRTRRRRRAIPVDGGRAGGGAAILAALAALLLRSGERVALLQGNARPLAGRPGLDRLAEALAGTASNEAGLPAELAVPRHARVVLFSDFLSPLPEIQAVVARLAGIPVTGTLLQVLDPAEALLPYSGRVRFRGLEREGETLIPRVEGVRDEEAAACRPHHELVKDLLIQPAIARPLEVDHHAEDRRVGDQGREDVNAGRMLRVEVVPEDRYVLEKRQRDDPGRAVDVRDQRVRHPP